MILTKNKNRFFFWVFIPIWALIFLWNMLSPPQTFSETENRYLATFPAFSFPELLNGEFMDAINTYLNDQFAGRPYWVAGQTVSEYALGKREVNGVYLGRGALLSSLPAQSENYAQQNVNGINAFSAGFEMPVYVLLVPSAAAVQPQLLPLFAQPWDEAAFIRETEDGLSTDVDVISITETFDTHREEYLYYRTDHHWTTYGAYLAYTELARAMGLAATSQQQMNVSEVSEDFLGSLYSKTVFPLIQPDTVERYESGSAHRFTVFDGQNLTEYDSIYFDEYLDKKDKYSYFLGQVQPIVTLETAAANDKTLVVFKDSYAHAMMPMLLEDYRVIHLVDLRYVTPQILAAHIDLDACDAALFLYSTDVFAHQLGPGKLTLF